MIAVILIFYRQKDKHRTIMERKQTKRIIIFLLLLLGIILPNMAQKQKIWKAFCDKCRREKTIVGALPSQLEKALRWSPGISNEQKEVIRYILWNMVLRRRRDSQSRRKQRLSCECGLFFHQPL